MRWMSAILRVYTRISARVESPSGISSPSATICAVGSAAMNGTRIEAASPCGVAATVATSGLSTRASGVISVAGRWVVSGFHEGIAGLVLMDIVFSLGRAARNGKGGAAIV